MFEKPIFLEKDLFEKKILNVFENKNQRWSREHKARGQGHKKKSEANAKDSPSEGRPSRGQGQELRTQVASVLQKNKKRSSKIFFSPSTKF